MSRNHLLQATLEVDAAIQALRLRKHHLRGVTDGVEIEQPGKPTLLLTFENARRFARQMEEAEHG